MPKKTTRIIKNPVAKALRTPRYKQQVIRDKTKHTRKQKHKDTTND